MSRKQNYRIGSDAERRIGDVLESHGRIVRSDNWNAYPDLFFSHSERRSREIWALGCKTIKGIHAGNEVGAAKISRSEFRGMQELTDKGYNVGYVMEIRPRGARKEDYPYLFVPWKSIAGRYERTKPRDIIA